MSTLLGHAPIERPTEPADLTQYLYEKYGQRVFTFCYSRLRNREEAQDAAQTTFIYVMRSLQRGIEPEFELAGLLKIAFNVCRGTRRSTGRHTAATQEIEDMDALAAPPAAGYEGSERLAALRDGLAHLPERQRRGILLREWQGLSYAEIADELGLSLGAVETLLFRARRNLAERLQHVRTGVGALNAATLAPFFRSLARGGLGKLGLIGAGATVALVPVVATEIAPALAHGKAAVTLRSAAPADLTKTPRLAPATRRAGAALRATAPRSRAVTDGVRQAQLPQQPAMASAASAADPVQGPATSTPGSLEQSATSPSAPSITPTVQTPVATAVGVAVPKLEPPAGLPPAATEPLDALTSVLSGVPGALP